MRDIRIGDRCEMEITGKDNRLRQCKRRPIDVIDTTDGLEKLVCGIHLRAHTLHPLHSWYFVADNVH